MATDRSGVQPRQRESVLVPRVVLGSIFVACVFFPAQLQPILTAIYSYVYHHSALYRFSGFETLQTIFLYALIELPFTYKFGHSPELRIDVRGEGSRPGLATRATGGEGDEKTEQKAKGPKLPKMKRPSGRMGEMFIYAAPLFLMDMTMVKKYAGVPVADIVATGGYEALVPTTVSAEMSSRYDSPFRPDSLAEEESDSAVPMNITLPASTDTDGSEGASYGGISPSFLLPTLHNFTLSSPFQTTRALPPPQPNPPTTRQIVLQLIGALVIYDSLFFLFHLVLHRPPVFKSLITSLHSPHHTHAEMHPQVTNRLSITERLALVLLANFSLNLVGAHVLTRTCFVPVFVFLLVQIHSGLDLDWGYERILPPGWAGGSVVHAHHHRLGGDEHLAPFFAWCDAALRRWDRWVGRERKHGLVGAEAKVR